MNYPKYNHVIFVIPYMISTLIYRMKKWWLLLLLMIFILRLSY